MNVRRSLPPPGAIIALATALLAVMVMVPSTRVTVAPETEITAQGQMAAIAEDDFSSLSPIIDRQETIALFGERPLLAEGRRPPPPAETLVTEEPQDAVAEPVVEPPAVPEAVAEPEPPKPPALHMLGSMIEGNSTQALIRDDSDGQERWFGLGADIDGWTLVEISQSSIRLQSGPGEITIRLFD